MNVKLSLVCWKNPFVSRDVMVPDKGSQYTGSSYRLHAKSAVHCRGEVDPLNL